MSTAISGIHHGVVIVGAGQAGFWVAKTLRARGYKDRVVLIGDEAHPPYERPPLSKGLLHGLLDHSKTYFATPDALRDERVEFMAHARVASIERDARHVVLTDGRRIGYDILVLTMGGRGRALPPVHSVDIDILYLRSIEDAQAIRQALNPRRPLLVIGGGWIGLEIAAAARAREVPVTLVESAPQLCGRVLPPRVSDFLLRLHQSHAVDVRLNSSVKEIATPASVLSTGERVPSVVVVAGIGMLPNSEVAAAAGLDVDGGILVDEFCRTSDPAILAAGDVARYPSATYGRTLRLESWHNAQAQGMAAAMTILGEGVPHDPLPWFWSDQYDVNLQVLGIPDPRDVEVIRGDSQSNSFSLYYLRAARIAAVISINQARENRVARKLMERAVSVDPAMISDGSIDLQRLLRRA